MRFVMILTVLSCLGFGAAAAADARPGLSSEDDINAGLLAVGIADEIRKNCDSIQGRVFKALIYMKGLERMARARGYSGAEIDAYVDSDEEEARLRRKGEAYLAAKGVDPSRPDTFCALGQAEIANGSSIGIFLKAK